MNKYVGSSFDAFLEEEGLLVEANAEALQRVLAWQSQVIGSQEERQGEEDGA